LYVLLEHNFWAREQDIERGVSITHPSFCCLFLTGPISYGFQVLSLPPVVAPTKVLIVPLSAKAEFDPLIQEVCTSFSRGLDTGRFSAFVFSSIEAAQGGHLLTRGRFKYFYRKTVRAQ
jgi:hypothetical protein